MALVADGQAIGSLGDAAGMAGRWGAQRRLIQRLGWRVFDQIPRGVPTAVTRLNDLPEPAASSMIVYYDGGCPLCSREIRVMRRLDRHRRLSFLDVTRQEVEDMDRDALLRRFHVRGSDGHTVSGAAAFAAVWRELPALGWLGRLAEMPPFSWGLEFAYGIFLNLRPGLQAVVRRLESGGRGL